MGKHFFTAAEKRDLVLEYLASPYGQRQQMLARRGVTPSAFRHLRRRVMAEALEQGLIPRGGVWVSAEENKELARLHKENQQLRAQLKEANQRREAQEKVVEALGKAIGLLQDGTATPAKGPSQD